jgi:hypothetical protein
MNVVLHAKARAKRGKGPSMSIGVIKNPKDALYIAKQIADMDDCLYWPDEDSAIYQKKRDELVSIVRGYSDFEEFRNLIRTEVKAFKAMQKAQEKFNKLHPVVRRPRKTSTPVETHSIPVDGAWGQWH